MTKRSRLAVHLLVLITVVASMPAWLPAVANAAPARVPLESPGSVPQKEETADGGIECLAALCKELGIKTTVAELRKLCGAAAKRPTLSDLERCARLKGLKASVSRVNVPILQQSRSYGIAWMGRDGHAAFGPGPGTSAWLWQVAAKRKRIVPYAEVVGRSQGLVLLCQPKSRLNAVD